MKTMQPLVALAGLAIAVSAQAYDGAGATAVRHLSNTAITYGNVASLWFKDGLRLNAMWNGGGSSSEPRTKLEFDLYNPLLGWNSYRHVWVRWTGSADARSWNRVYLLDRDGTWVRVATGDMNSRESTTSLEVSRPNRFILPNGGCKMRFDIGSIRQCLIRLDRVELLFEK